MTQGKTHKIRNVPAQWSQYVDAFLKAEGVEQESLWTRADIVLEVNTRYGEGSVENLADDVDVSARRLWEMRRTAATFQKCERSQYLSFHHHTLATRTDDPHEWIAAAFHNNWSTRDLDQVIKEATEGPSTPWDEMKTEGQRLDRASRKFFDSWTSLAINGKHQQFVVGQARVLHRICQRVIESEGRSWRNWT